MDQTPVDSQAGPGDDYEEITSDEVDRVIGELEALMESVQSENIRSCLEEAANSIFFLVYEDEDLEHPTAEAA